MKTLAASFAASLAGIVSLVFPAVVQLVLTEIHYAKSQQLWHAGGSGRAATRRASQHSPRGVTGSTPRGEAHHLNCADVNLNCYNKQPGTGCIGWAGGGCNRVAVDDLFWTMGFSNVWPRF